MSVLLQRTKLEVPGDAKKLTTDQVPDLDDVPSLSRREEQSDHVQAHRRSVSGCDHLSLCLELGERFEIPGMVGFISTAEAVVGRPLTPVSCAGVARRTARRCAAGVYC
jgi:hypothetical protein